MAVTTSYHLWRWTIANALSDIPVSMHRRTSGPLRHGALRSPVSGGVAMVRSLCLLLCCGLLGEPTLAQTNPEFDVPCSPPPPARAPGSGLAAEWRSHADRRAIGLEVAGGGCGGRIGDGYDRHEVDLTGLHACLYTAIRLGGEQEVQP
jgi:hypothetical protein